MTNTSNNLVARLIKDANSLIFVLSGKNIDLLITGLGLYLFGIKDWYKSLLNLAPASILTRKVPI